MTKYNWKGWKFTEWLNGNSQTIKEGLKVGIPLLTVWVATGSIWQTAFGVILGKFILDSAHYWIKE